MHARWNLVMREVPSSKWSWQCFSSQCIYRKFVIMLYFTEKNNCNNLAHKERNLEGYSSMCMMGKSVNTSETETFPYVHQVNINSFVEPVNLDVVLDFIVANAIWNCAHKTNTPSTLKLNAAHNCIQNITTFIAILWKLYVSCKYYNEHTSVSMGLAMS